jgi:hypothetical protein
MKPEVPQLRDQLERSILSRTGRRIRNLAVELCSEQVILHGRAGSYHLKQLAQRGVQDLLPNARLQNAIIVEAIVR